MFYLSEILPIRFYEHFDGLQFQSQKNTQSSFLLADEWLKGEAIKLQIQADNSTYSFKLYDNGELLSISVNQTPAGWLGTQIYSLDYTPTDEGFINLELKVYVSNVFVKSLTADCLKVVNRMSDDYLRLTYYNTYNNNGICYNKSGGTYIPTTFLRGDVLNVTTTGQFETMTDADGQKALLKATQEKVYNVNLWGLNNYQAVMASLISGSDRVTINDMQVMFDKPFEIESSKQEAINTLKGQAVARDWDMVHEYSVSSSGVITQHFARYYTTSEAYVVQLSRDNRFFFSVNGSSLIEVTASSGAVYDCVVPPDSYIDVYATAVVGLKNDSIKKAIFYDLTGIASMKNVANNCTKLASVIFNNSTSLIHDWSFSFHNCRSLSNIDGIDLSGAAFLISTFDSCSSLETLITSMPQSGLIDATSMFNGCSVLTDVISNIHTVGAQAENMFKYCESLKYPNYPSAEWENMDWKHYTLCDMQIETVNIADFVEIRNIGGTVRIHKDTISYDSLGGFYPVVNSDFSTFIGVDFLTGITGLSFANNVIRSFILRSIPSTIVNLDNFLANQTNISNISIRCQLPNVTSAASAFKGSSTLPDFFDAQACLNVQSFAAANKGVYTFVNFNANNYSQAFANCQNLRTIRGQIIKSTGDNVANMFNNTNTIKPDLFEIDHFQEFTEYTYTYI